MKTVINGHDERLGLYILSDERPSVVLVMDPLVFLGISRRLKDSLVTV